MTLFAGVPAGVKVLSVSEITAEVKGLLEDAFPCAWVAGEISNFTRATSGHIYFSLKDAGAQLKAVIWRGNAGRVRFQLNAGLQVVARGKIGVYPPNGNYQLLIDEIHPRGIGALELAFRQLKEKLAALGWFEAERKRPLPRFPRCIGIVTSATGAAIRDMLRIIPRRWPIVDVVVYPVLVQGDGAANEIAAAIRQFNRWRCADVLIVGRGGGSIEDLWAFNEEIVAEAIFRSLIPIISAVGHETDFTIADFVADHRAATPSEAAELVVPDFQEFHKQLKTGERHITSLMTKRLTRARERLTAITQCRVLRQPLERVRTLQQVVDEWSSRLQRSIRLHVERQQQRVEKITGKLHSLSPLNVLQRGYSLTVLETSETLLRSASEVQAGSRIVTRLASGQLVSRVEQTRANP